MITAYVINTDGMLRAFDDLAAALMAAFENAEASNAPCSVYSTSNLPDGMSLVATVSAGARI